VADWRDSKLLGGKTGGPSRNNPRQQSLTFPMVVGSVPELERVPLFVAKAGQWHGSAPSRVVEKEEIFFCCLIVCVKMETTNNYFICLWFIKIVRDKVERRGIRERIDWAERRPRHVGQGHQRGDHTASQAGAVLQAARDGGAGPPHFASRARLGSVPTSRAKGATFPARAAPR
jgi:hypothetical protein